MRTLFIISSLLCFQNLSFSQKRTLKEKLKQADSVLLISHKMTSRSTNVVVNSEGQVIKLPDLIIRGSLNNQLVVERKLLSKSEIDTLIKVLTYSYKPSRVITKSGCFDPHHSIIIKKGDRNSFIDLCFHCLDFETSPDIVSLQIKDDKWDKLYKLFSDYGFKYEMSTQADE